MRTPVLLGVLVAAAVASAQPHVRVRSESFIELRTTRTANRLDVQAILRDDLGAPLAERPLDLRISDASDGLVEQHRATTDANGVARASFTLVTGAYALGAAFGGDEWHALVRARQAIDVSRAHVRLSIQIPSGGRLDLDQPEHTIRALAESEEGGADLPIELTDDLGRVLGRGRTDASARAAFRGRSDQLGPPAAGRLIVRTAGDARRAAAQTEAPVIRFRPSHLTLHADRGAIREGEILRVEGRLSDSTGPMPRRAIGLFANDQHLETVLSDARGRFARELELGAIDDATIVARFESDAPWRTSAASAPVRVHVQARGSTPWAWLLLSIAACAIILVVIWRSGPRARPAPAPAEEVAPGVVLAAADRGPERSTIVRGRVVRADDGAAIAGATVSATGPEQRSATSASDGTFSLGSLEPGRWEIVIEARGFEPATASATLPHRGQWEGLVARLRALRDLALTGYRPLAQELAPDLQPWTLATPREIAGQAGPPLHDEVAALAARVEQAVFAADPPDADEVARIRREANKLADEVRERR